MPSRSNEFSVRDSSNITIIRGDISLKTGVSINDGAWHLISVSWRGRDGFTQLFKDGTLVSGILSPNTLLPDNGHLIFGQRYNDIGTTLSTDHTFQGRLDQIKVYSRMLDLHENQTLFLDDLGLVGAWHLMNNREILRLDFSNSGNNLTIHKTDGVHRSTMGTIQLREASDYIIKSNYKNFPDDEMTTSFWIKTKDSKDGILSYASKRSDNDWFISNSGNLTITKGVQSIQTSISINDEQWHFIAITWKSTTGELIVYIDGEVSFNNILSPGERFQDGGTLVLGQDQDKEGGGFEKTQAHKEILMRLDFIIGF